MKLSELREGDRVTPKFEIGCIPFGTVVTVVYKGDCWQVPCQAGSHSLWAGEDGTPWEFNVLPRVVNSPLEQSIQSYCDTELGR